MNSLKKSLWAKLTAYFLLLIFVTMTVLCAVIALFNAERGWYSKGSETIQQEINENAALSASSEIMQHIAMVREEQGVYDSEIEDDWVYKDESGTYYEDDMEEGAYYDEEGNILNEADAEKLEEKIAAQEKVAEAETLKKEIEAVKGIDGEIISGEKDAVDFGYAIYLKQDEKKKNAENLLREVTDDLRNSPEVYTKTYDHGDMDIEIYLKHTEPDGSGFPESISQVFRSNENIYHYRNGALAAGVVSLLVSIVLFVFLMVSAGRGRSSNAAKAPMDLLAAVAVVIIYFFGVMFIGNFSIESSGYYLIGLVVGVMGIAAVSVAYLFLFAAAVKQAGWWKKLILYRLLRLLKRIGRNLMGLLRQIPLVWKTAVAMLAIILVNLILIPNMTYSSEARLLWGLSMLTISVFVIYIAIGMKRLQEGAKHLADGDLSYQIEKKGLRWELAEHANNLNSIGSGMAKALEERLKSERFKAELITNVSHDIKTPLTSIINYVDFLKSEELDNEKAKEYIEVLDRQSRRLKKLTDDLVEASKAATGNVKVEMTPCQVGIMMTQIMGEYKEKAEANDLNFIMRLPEEELEIMADGRRLWRVFDNLLSNICKYSQPGTRVYLTLEEKNNKAAITYRNTSKYELNITEEELVERFVRGDSSRHTEGSGLGLSIAQNLVQLQGGEFHIFIDGDLFKVVIEFELLK